MILSSPSILFVPTVLAYMTLTHCVSLNCRQIYKKSFLPLEEYYNFPDFFSPTMSDNDIGATSRQTPKPPSLLQIISCTLDRPFFPEPGIHTGIHTCQKYPA